ncbi:Hpt domain-containing protein [Mariprofundus micogutta]|nr:Hpt domain-containing protein [Mariprofundus micogutta]
MNDHIAKPIEPLDLYIKLDKWISTGRTHLETLNDTETFTSVPIPPITGIDIEEGLMRAGDDHSLYRKILLRFCDSQVHAIKNARGLVKSGEPEEARNIIHSLKGAVGNLGAKEMYRLVSRLEQELRDDLRLNDELARIIECELPHMIVAIKTALEIPETGVLYDTPQDRHDTGAQMISNMLAMVEACDSEVIDLLPALSDALTSRGNSIDLTMLEKAMHAYDFDSAETELKKLIKLVD